MALDEFTKTENTGYVAPATVEMGSGQVDEVERQAKAQVSTAKVDIAKSDKAKTDAAGMAPKTGSTEGKVYGDIIADAVGLKTVSDFMEVLGTRAGDHAQIKAGKAASPSAPKHIEHDIRGAARAPGMYRAPATPEKFGAGQANPDMSNVGIVEKAGLASASLQGEKGSSNLQSWSQKAFKETKVEKIPEQKKALELQNKAELSKQTTYSKENASEAALDSVVKVRAQQSAMVAKAQELAPGMGSGPKFNPSQYLRDARDENEGKA